MCNLKHYAAFFCWFAWLTGCTALPLDGVPLRTKKPSLSASLEPPPNPSVPSRINLLSSPRALRSEFSYPPMMTRQRLIWDEDGLEWRLRFPARQYAYAAVILRRPTDLKLYYSRMRLMFKIRPARMTAFLSVALADRPTSGFPALSDVPLIDRAPPLGDGWTTVSIPLNDFPAATIFDSAPGVVMAATADVQRALDWASIQEIRIISSGGRIPAHEIFIRDVRFQRL